MQNNKILSKIELQIKNAQNYLKKANQYYEKSTEDLDDFKYVKRLVEDNQPVVLTKKMRKQLKLADKDPFAEAQDEDL